MEGAPPNHPRRIRHKSHNSLIINKIYKNHVEKPPLLQFSTMAPPGEIPSLRIHKRKGDSPDPHFVQKNTVNLIFLFDSLSPPVYLSKVEPPFRPIFYPIVTATRPEPSPPGVYP